MPELALLRSATTQGGGVLAALLLLIGCSGHVGQGDHQFEIVYESGVPTAVNSGAPRFSGELFTYEELLEIREDDSQPESLMKNVVTPWYGPDGRYYFVDANASRVVVFDSSGRFDQSIGRHGGGPGELQYPLLLSFHGGTLNVTQWNPLKVTRFDLSGSYMDYVARDRPPAVSRSGRAPHLDVAADGSVLLGYYEIDRGESTNAFRACMVVTRAKGDTLSHLRTDWVTQQALVTMDLGRGPRTSTVYIQFAAPPQIAYAPRHGIILTSGRIPELDFYDLNGRLQRRIRLDIPAEAVTEEDRGAYLSEYDEQIAAFRAQESMGQGEVGVQRSREFRDNARFADTKSFWAGIRVDDAGWLWLLKTVHEIVDYDKPRTPSYRILNPAGEYIGDTTLPPAQTAAPYHDRIVQEQVDPGSGERAWIVYAIRPRVSGLDYP